MAGAGQRGDRLGLRLELVLDARSGGEGVDAELKRLGEPQGALHEQRCGVGVFLGHGPNVRDQRARGKSRRKNLLYYCFSEIIFFAKAGERGVFPPIFRPPPDTASSLLRPVPGPPDRPGVARQGMHTMRFGPGGSKDEAARTRAPAAGLAAHETLSLSVLVGEAAATGPTGRLSAGAAGAGPLMAQAALLREIARRGGQVEMLAKAAAAANRARREAGANATLAARALLEQAQTQRLGFLLFADAQAAAAARAHVEAALALSPDPLTAVGLQAVRAGLDGAEALAARDAAAALHAIHALEVAVKAAGLLRAPLDRLAALVADRAELMVGLALHGHDRTLAAHAEADLAALIARLDPDRTPLSWVRAETLRGQALAAIGDIAGDAACIAEAVAALKAAAAALPPHHSPLDEARTGHTLGLALQAMGEACEEDVLFDRAVRAFSPALEALDRTPTLPYRAILAHDGALCLARRAERRGDLGALEQAEATFRSALKARKGPADPLAWAVTQVALARIYEAQATLRPDTGERADAAFALASALDVFTEHGLRSLAAATLAALERVKVGG